MPAPKCKLFHRYYCDGCQSVVPEPIDTPFHSRECVGNRALHTVLPNSLLDDEGSKDGTTRRLSQAFGMNPQNYRPIAGPKYHKCGRCERIVPGFEMMQHTEHSCVEVPSKKPQDHLDQILAVYVEYAFDVLI